MVAKLSLNNARAARIGAAIRRHLATPDWAWRHTGADDPIDGAAVSRLREWRDRAARWGELLGAGIGMPMPAGNGAGGPWQRSVVLDDAGYAGVADIAAGRVAWTDVHAPSYVRRLALPVGRAASPHPAGGTGGMGSATAQLAVVYGMMHRTVPVICPVPRPTVRWVEWGLQTCYGHAGEPPAADDYRSEWAALAGVPASETTVPQWETVVETVSPALVSEWAGVSHPPRPWTRGAAQLRTRPCCTVGRVDLEVLGVGDERRTALAALRTEWAEWVSAEAARRATIAALAVFRDGCVSVPEPAGVRGWHPDERVRQITPEVARHVLAHVRPADPLSAADRAEVGRLASGLLGRDPVVAGEALRDPWGRPGYPHGANHITYLLPRGTRQQVWTEVWDTPGVRDWIADVREAASALRRRLGDGPDGGGIDEAEIAALEATGYAVRRSQYGRIVAVERAALDGITEGCRALCGVLEESS